MEPMVCWPDRPTDRHLVQAGVVKAGPAAWHERMNPSTFVAAPEICLRVLAPPSRKALVLGPLLDCCSSTARLQRDWLIWFALGV